MIAHAATATNLEAEHIQRVPGPRVLLDFLHRADDPEPGIWIVDRDVWERDRAHPSADTGVDGDVLLAVRTQIGDRVRHDAGSALELPQLGAGARVDRLEPAVHRAVEHHVAGGREHAAVDRELLFLGAPDFLALHRIPRHQLAVIAARPRVHLHARAEIRRAGDVVRLYPLVVHAGVVRRNVDQTGPRRERRRRHVLRAGRRRTDAARDHAELRALRRILDRLAA